MECNYQVDVTVDGSRMLQYILGKLRVMVR